MTSLTKIALAIALSTGVSGLALTAPAVAAKKKDEAPAGPKLSPDFLKVAQTAQTALNAKDLATAAPALDQMDGLAKTDDDRYFAASLRYNLEQLKIQNARAANPNAPVDETALAKPLDALIASPVTKQDAKAKFAYQRGILAYNGKQFPVAIQYFTQAKQLGETDPNLSLQLAQAKVSSGDVAGGLTELDTTVQAQIAAGQKPDEDVFRYGISRANQAKLGPQTMTWIQRYIATYPTRKNWRDAVVTYGLAGNSVEKLTEAQKIDLFRLLRATNALADQNDYLEYADDVQRRGLPAEAQAVIKEGQAAGKIPASNALAKQILTDATNALKVEGSLAPLEAKANAAANGKLAAGTGDAYLGTGDYAKAAALYRTALQKGGVDADEVNTHLGIALARSGDKAGAKAAFGAVKAAPRSNIAALWTTYLDAPAPTA
ncbi:hypothetical protein GCM10011380_20980 [Sphingomonas metalli]|uniref:Tetratricopeptide repeat protein n=1 Tax=Sphingomonas metalli TaxID=1779358 RepID=A0A916T4T8_9SPHN|nr:hypothetical protein [Sphingomonas metalli]GGB31416.1 hypothetical protein GCM10011380_20980 [Sphingomonas metalli]